jgi:hypothetical protein
MNPGKIAIALLCIQTTFAAITDREEWDKRFYNFTGPFLVQGGDGGAPGPIAVYREGEFLIGGRFTNLADTPLLNLARWDGTTWRKPFEGILNEQAGEIRLASGSAAIHSIATHQNTDKVEVLISGFGLTNAGGVPVGNVAWWTGSEWNDMAGGTTGLVSTAVFDADGKKFVGGIFSMIGGVTATNVAAFSGTDWKPLGSGLPFVPDALAIHNGELYAAGPAPSTTDGTYAFLRWAGTEWLPAANAFPAGSGARILTLLSRPEGLYVGGAFTNIGTITATNIALWTGTEWQALGGGLQAQVRSLASHQNSVIAAGPFRTAALQRTGLSRWDGTNWFPQSGLPIWDARSVTASGERILTRGWVDNGLDTALNGAAFFDGEVWKPLGQGISPGLVTFDFNTRNFYLIAQEDGVLMAGTWPINLPGTVRRWNGEYWERIGASLTFPTSITGLEPQGELLWVGARGPWNTPAPARIAATDGTNWLSPGEIFINDIVVAGAKVYAGGNTGLFELNDNQFTPVPGFTNVVVSLATDGNSVYVASRPQPNYAQSSIHRFDGHTWTHLGGSITNAGRFEISFLHGSLYAYGSFSRIEGQPTSPLCRWDGQQWQQVLPGITSSRVLSVTSDGRDSLYVGTFGGVRTNLLQVRGSSVTPVPIAGSIEALAWWRGGLYVGGSFTSTVTVSSLAIAAWHDPEAAVEVIVSAPTNAISGTEAEIILHVANVRTGALSNVQLTMPLAPGATAVELGPNMAVQGTNLVWSLANVPSGSTNVSASVRLQGTPGTNFTFEVWASGPSIPTFRSAPAWTSIAAPTASPEIHIETVIRNPDGSFSLRWSEDEGTRWVVERSSDLQSWDAEVVGLTTNEFIVPPSSEMKTFWRIRAESAAP